MAVKTGSVTRADTLEIQPWGRLLGCGTIDAVLQNDGIVIVDCGGASGLILNGSATNQREIVLQNGSRLTATGATFTNLRDGDPTLPGLLTNAGRIVLDPADSAAVIVRIAITGDDVEVHAATSMIRSYHLRFGTDLDGWTDVTTPEPGRGTMVFVHPGGANAPGGKCFYQVVESD